MLFFGYTAAIFMGLTLGMLGGGGSIMTVPILVYLFSINPVIASGYSLFTVGLTASVGGYFYFKRNEVDLKTGLIFAIPSFSGVYFSRSYILPHLPDPVFVFGNLSFTKALLIMLVFSILMLGASYSMIKGRKDKALNKNKPNLNQLTNTGSKLLIPIIGFATGCVTGFVGAGGGFLIIPALVVLVDLPMKIAVGTSLSIIAANSLIGFIGDLKHQTATDWQLLLSLAAIAIVGLFIGMNLSKKISDKNLKKSFGYFILIMGTFILIDQLKKL
jgi:uncharacterized membrane protein YfcA